MNNILFVAGSNSIYSQIRSKPAGFLAGIWHGLILPITFVISLFNHGVGIYETNNNGGWYNLGFIFGLSSVFGGSGSQIN